MCKKKKRHVIKLNSVNTVASTESEQSFETASNLTASNKVQLK